jgi:MerR family transcriptional regulator, light-induced transcriptional regulator
MAERRYVSTAQVAEALGVSVTTVKRWVDEGILPAQKTPGGHRKLLLAEVVRVTREGDLPHLDLARLGLAAPDREPLDPAALSARLLAALRQGDGGAARALVQEAHGAGLPAETLADAVVAPAMAQLGHEWEKGRLDVLHEHRGTQLCAAALYVLKAALEANAGEGRPVAVGGGPEGDPYLLANLLAELVLLEAGWEAINLGPNTPLASFRKALEEFRPRLLWLSVSSLAGSGFLAGYPDLYRHAGRLGSAVAVGGRGLTETVRAGMPYTTFGDGMTHLAAFVRSLSPRPRRPRRGRPRGAGKGGGRLQA